MTTPITPNSQLRAMLEQFTVQAGGPTNPYVEVVVSAITSSPSLIFRMNADVASGALRSINYQASESGAYYTNGTINIGANFIQPPGQEIRSLNDLVFVLGHELRHVGNSAAMDAFDSTWRTNVLDRLTTGGNRDVTDLVRARVDEHLRDEGSANLEGVNDVIGRAIVNKGGVGLSQQEVRLLGKV